MQLKKLPEVAFQVVMGPANPGPWRTGTVADLYVSLFDIAKTFVPPLDVLNDKLRSGVDRAGEHGIHVRWVPLELDAAEYGLFCHELLSRRESEPFRLVECPPAIATWDDWSWWVYKTHLEPPTASQGGDPSAEEIELKRKYRLALLDDDASAAETLVARIRGEYDPGFS